MTERGCYIALEGRDHSGKTTQARRLAASLDACLTCEPGGTELGVHLRAVVLGDDSAPSARAETLLFAADRAEHVARVVAPALSAGRHVVTDRSYGSTLAYQGYGRGFGLSDLTRLVDWASRLPFGHPAAGRVPEPVMPDLVILLDADHAQTQRRFAGVPDRIEREPTEFSDRVADGYRRLAAADPARWSVVDASASVEQVAQRIERLVADRLGVRPAAARPHPCADDPASQ